MFSAGSEPAIASPAYRQPERRHVNAKELQAKGDPNDRSQVDVLAPAAATQSTWPAGMRSAGTRNVNSRGPNASSVLRLRFGACIVALFANQALHLDQRGLVVQYAETALRAAGPEVDPPLAPTCTRWVARPTPGMGDAYA